MKTLNLRILNNFIDFIKRKMTDKFGVNAQQTANATAAPSTGALSTAVDRMSFAHDIVMVSDEAIAIGLGADIHVSFNASLFFLALNSLIRFALAGY